MEFTSTLPFMSKRTERDELPFNELEQSLAESIDEDILLKASGRKDPLRSSMA
jgi:hypothetical protein